MSTLVLENFNLRRYPFSSEIEACALYPFDSFRQGQLRLEQGVSQRGMALVAGEPGAGKTALARYFTSRLAPSSHQVLYTAVPIVRNPIRPVVEHLLSQIGESIPFNNTARGLSRLQQAIVRQHQHGQLPVVIVDDVHYLDPPSWQLLKGLTNHEMDSKVPLLLLLLGARQEVLTTLALNRLDEVRNRFLFCHHLRGLEEKEIGSYLEAHLKWAGCDRPLFPREVARDLHQRAHGLPRLINRLAHGCLLAAAFDHKELVDTPCLEQAASESLFSMKG